MKKLVNRRILVLPLQSQVNIKCTRLTSLHPTITHALQIQELLHLCPNETRVRYDYRSSCLWACIVSTISSTRCLQTHLEFFCFLVSRGISRRQQRACMPHRLALRRRPSRNHGNDRLGIRRFRPVLLDKFCRVQLGFSSNLSNDDDALGVVMINEELESINLGGPWQTLVARPLVKRLLH